MKTLLIIAAIVVLWLVCGWLAKRYCRCASSKSTAMFPNATYYGFGPIALLSELLIHRSRRFGKLGALVTALLLCSAAVSAQTSNAHVAGTINASSNLGFKNPSPGITGGFDYRHKRMVLSGDLALDKIEKSVGGHGWQLSGRETARGFFGRFFVQGGASEAHYSVTKFSKSTIEPLAGIGYADKSFVVQANYLKDVSSFNHQNVFEGSVTFYLKRHIYVKGSVAADRFKSNKVWMSGVATTIAVGVWK